MPTQGPLMARMAAVSKARWEVPSARPWGRWRKGMLVLGALRGEPPLGLDRGDYRLPCGRRDSERGSRPLSGKMVFKTQVLLMMMNKLLIIKDNLKMSPLIIDLVILKV